MEENKETEKVLKESDKSTSTNDFDKLEERINDKMTKLFKLNEETLQRMFSDFMTSKQLNDSGRDETKQMIKESKEEKRNDEVIKEERKEDYYF